MLVSFHDLPIALRVIIVCWHVPKISYLLAFLLHQCPYSENMKYRIPAKESRNKPETKAKALSNIIMCSMSAFFYQAECSMIRRKVLRSTVPTGQSSAVSLQCLPDTSTIIIFKSSLDRSTCQDIILTGSN